MSAVAPVAVAANPFSTALAAPKAQSTNPLSAGTQQREIAEVQAAMMIARLNPRDPIAAMDRILQACTRPTLAESALYSYSRGGADVTGPSIRLAETLAQCWGNFQFGVRELEQRNGESTVEAFAWDIETNTRQVKVFQVPHERHTKRGVTRLTDPRDIYELVANQGARRLRACILGVIPGDVTETAVKQCDATLQTKVEITPDLIRTLIEKFAEFGVTKEHIEARIQRHIESILPAQVVQMRKVYNSLKDGMSQPSDWFEIAPATPAVDPAVADLNSEIAKQQPTTAPRPAAPKPADKGGPKVTYASIEAAMRAAKNRDDLDTAAAPINTLPNDQQKGLNDEYRRLLAALEA